MSVAIQRKPASLYAQPPENRIGKFFWKWRLRLSSTFAMTMLEPWECYAILIICLGITVTFWMSVYSYYPGHLAYLSRRFAYYVYDDETVDLGRAVREWLRDQVGRVTGLLRGAGPGKEL